MDEGQLGIGEELFVEMIDCTVIEVPRARLEDVREALAKGYTGKALELLDSVLNA